MAVLIDENTQFVRRRSCCYAALIGAACVLSHPLSAFRWQRPAEWWKKDRDPRLSRRYAAGSCGCSGVVITSLSRRSMRAMEPSER